MIVGIVVALPQELKTLTHTKLAKGDTYFITDHIVVALAGTGLENAQRAAQLLVDLGAKRLISWGCAAAIRETVRPGDLVMPTGLVTADKRLLEQNPATQSWHAKSQQLLAASMVVHSGCLYGSDLIVADSAAKQKIAQQTKAIALDMESVAVVRVAENNQLPYLVLRAIADPVEMSLPKAVGYAVNDQGEVALLPLCGYLLLHPAELYGLIRLAVCFNAAQKTLQRVAKQLNHLVGLH